MTAPTDSSGEEDDADDPVPSGPDQDDAAPPDPGAGPWDLTRPLVSGMDTYPGDPEVSLTPHATVAEDGYRVTRLTLGSHAGTHVDAPAHTEPDGATIDDLPVDRFRLDAALVDLADDLDAREAITPDELPGTLPEGHLPDALADADLLAIRTGWDREWGDPRYRDHPYLAPGTARLLADAGLAVGLDCLSPDPTPSPDATAVVAAGNEPEGVPAHRALLGAGVPVVENLRGLDAVPSRFELHVYPLLLADGDGSPVRAVAWPRGRDLPPGGFKS